MSVVALVPAAGQGVRLGAHVDGVALPKALVPVAGETLLVRAVGGLLASGCVDRVVVAAPSAHLEQMRALVTEDPLSLVHNGLAAQAESPPRVTFVAGGADRTRSVRAALAEALDAKVVLVHDAARAFTPTTVIRAVVEKVLSGVDAVVPVLPVSDTIKQVDSDDIVTATVDRGNLRAVQTPQGFTPEVLRAAYERFPDSHTDDAGMVEKLGVAVHTIAGDHRSMKITTPFDLAVAEQVLSR